MSSLQRTMRRSIERMNWHPNKWYQLAIEEWQSRKKRADEKQALGYGKKFTEPMPKPKKYRRVMGHKRWLKIQRRAYLKQQREQAAQDELVKEQKHKAKVPKPARKTVVSVIRDSLKRKSGKA